MAGVQSLGQGPPIDGTRASGSAAAAGAPGPAGLAPGGASLTLLARELVLMRANMREVPYTFLRSGGKSGGSAPAGASGGGGGEPYAWAFCPCYSPVQPLLAATHEVHAIHRKASREERSAALEVGGWAACKAHARSAWCGDLLPGSTGWLAGWLAALAGWLAARGLPRGPRLVVMFGEGRQRPAGALGVRACLLAGVGGARIVGHLPTAVGRCGCAPCPSFLAS